MRSALCYGVKCWAFKKEDEGKLQTVKMTMLCMTFSYEAICNITGMKKIEEFLKEQKLQWSGRVGRLNDKRAPIKAKICC